MNKQAATTLMAKTLRAQHYFEPGRLPLAVREAHHGDQPIAPHAHDFIELVFFAQGRALHEYAGKRYTLSPGDLFIIHPGEAHAYRHGRRVRIYNCLFLPEAILPDLEYLRRMEGFFDLVMVEPFFRPETGLRGTLHLNAAARVRVLEWLREMRRELEHKAPGYEAAARAILIQVLVEAARCRAERSSAGRAQGGAPGWLEKRALIRDCMRYIETHYPEPIRLERLAGRAYLSPEYFSKIFKRLTRKTPVEFINAIRLDKAKELLAASSLNVTEIAFRTGFHDANYFARQFKKAVGQAPSAFRKRANGPSRESSASP